MYTYMLQDHPQDDPQDDPNDAPSLCLYVAPAGLNKLLPPN